MSPWPDSDYPGDSLRNLERNLTFCVIISGMSLNWDHEAENRYHLLNIDALRDRTVTLSLLGMTLFPLFSSLDYLTHRDQFQPLTFLRFSASFIFVLFYFLVKRRTPQNPYPMIIGLYLVATLSISLMCVVLGGFSSSYYAGINLILISCALFLPLNEKLMAALVSFILALYFLPSLILSPPHQVMMINNMFFLVATAIMCVTAAYLTERMRRESFLRFLELERTQIFLRSEIKTSQNSIEEMVKEISHRRKELERALSEAESSRSEAQAALQIREDFISLASHELNTPLTSLKLQTKVARMKYDSSPQENHAENYKKIIETYDAQLERLISMVDDMLDVARIKKGKFELNYSDVELSSIIRDIIAQTPTGNIQVKMHLNEAVVMSCDLFRLEQVILNLFNNALKYGNGKPVEIGLSKTASEAIIQVKDHGIGIAEEAQKKIFLQFERAVKAEEYKGLGLGLYISKKIVEAHQGQLQVESKPGEGSTFTVTLPLQPIHH